MKNIQANDRNMTIDQITENTLQQFGNLLIVDRKLSIIAISASVQEFTSIEIKKLLGLPLSSFLKKLNTKKHRKIEKTIEDLVIKKIPTQFFSKKIGLKYYFFKLHLHNDLVYIEWEEQQLKHISAARMNQLGFLFDKNYSNNWNFLCSAIQKLTKFERVFVLQIQDTGHSKVIAESLRTNKSSIIGKEFAQDFLPKDTIHYYDSLPYRYVPDLEKMNQKFYCIEPCIEPLCSQLATPPPLHIVYLKSIGVKAVLFFPLYLEGEFWGLIIAQHPNEKLIDLQHRKLCTFIVQTAMSKFENSFKQGLIDQNQQLLETETILKLSLNKNKTINCAMVENMELLTTMVKADGLAIYNHGDVFFHGHTPKTDFFHEIIEYLRTLTNKKIFKDYNFKLNHGNNFSQELPFSGLLFYTIGVDKDYYLTWFRREKISQVFQLELIEKEIRTWEEPIYNSALPWDDNELRYVNTLQQVIKECIVNKSVEKQLITDQLQTLNNELEMLTFSLSHDLKNPLSILKMGLQFLHSNNKNLSIEKKNTWLKNLLGSVSNIEDIINNIVTVSQSKTAAMVKDPIPMSYMIKKITQEAKLLNNCSDCEVHFGNLLPLWGEKSALYQIFLNIINNAIKYSSERKNPEIKIDSIMDDRMVYYRVTDNGIGIPNENLPNIFEIFTRANNVKTFQGTGVGLSLVKRIMDRLGGFINIESTLDSGTTVNLEFPISSPFPSSMLLQ